MAGYNWNAGKSNNAVAAEESGMVTRSKITKAWLTAAGITESPAFIKWMCKVDAIHAAEWHHSSKMFNEVNYYAAEDIAEQLTVIVNLEAWRAVFDTPEGRKADAYGARSLYMKQINAI